MLQDVTYSKESEVNFLTENTFQENQEKKTEPESPTSIPSSGTKPET